MGGIAMENSNSLFKATLSFFKNLGEVLFTIFSIVLIVTVLSGVIALISAFYKVTPFLLALVDAIWNFSTKIYL